MFTLTKRGTLPLALMAALIATTSGACSSDSPSGPDTSVIELIASLDGNGPDPNLLELALLWDGNEVDRRSFTEPQQNVALSDVITGVQAGTHTVGVTVVRQTMTPGAYNLNGSVFLGGPGGTQIFLPPTNFTLATGETASLQVTIP